MPKWTSQRTIGGRGGGGGGRGRGMYDLITMLWMASQAASALKGLKTPPPTGAEKLAGVKAGTIEEFLSAHKAIPDMPTLGTEPGLPRQAPFLEQLAGRPGPSPLAQAGPTLAKAEQFGAYDTARGLAGTAAERMAMVHKPELGMPATPKQISPLEKSKTARMIGAEAIKAGNLEVGTTLFKRSLKLMGMGDIVEDFTIDKNTNPDGLNRVMDKLTEDIEKGKIPDASRQHELRKEYVAEGGDGKLFDKIFDRVTKIEEPPKPEYKPGQALEKIATAQRAKATFDRTKMIDVAMAQLFPEFKPIMGKKLSPKQIATVNKAYDRLINYLEKFTPDAKREKAKKLLQGAGEPVTEANINYIRDQM